MDVATEQPIAALPRRSLRSPSPASKKRDAQDEAPNTGVYATRSKKMCLEWAPIADPLSCLQEIEQAADEEEDTDGDYEPADEVRSYPRQRSSGCPPVFCMCTCRLPRVARFAQVEFVALRRVASRCFACVAGGGGGGVRRG